MLPRQREKLQIQPPKTKIPLPRMPVCALEVSATSLGIRRDVPATATLIRNERQLVVLRHLLHKDSVRLDGLEPIGDGQGRAAQ